MEILDAVIFLHQVSFLLIWVAIILCPGLSCFSCVLLFVTWWTVAHQAPLSMGFSRREYWGGLPIHISNKKSGLKGEGWGKWKWMINQEGKHWNSYIPYNILYIQYDTLCTCNWNNKCRHCLFLKEDKKILFGSLALA